MRLSDPRERTMYVALASLLPVVQPSSDFSMKLWQAFEVWDEQQEYLRDNQAWADRMDHWLVTHTGLVFERPDCEPWSRYRVVDPHLYTMALLKYS